MAGSKLHWVWSCLVPCSYGNFPSHRPYLKVMISMLPLTNMMLRFRSSSANWRNRDRGAAVQPLLRSRDRPFVLNVAASWKWPGNTALIVEALSCNGLVFAMRPCKQAFCGGDEARALANL